MSAAEAASSSSSSATIDTLHKAVESGNLDTVKSIIATHGLADLNALNPQAEHPSDTNSGTPLAIAIKLHHLHIAEHLLKNGANVNQAINDGSGKGYTTAHIAARNGDIDALQLLQKHGADFNRAGEDGWTPLHAAAFAGKRAVLTYLCDHGAKVNAKNHHGVPAIFFSASHGRVNDCRDLLSRGATLDTTDVNGDYLFHHVMHYQLSKMFEGEYDVPDCQLDVAIVLAMFGMSVSATNIDGATGGKYYYENVPSLERVLLICSHNAEKFKNSKTEWNYMTLLRARVEHFLGMGLEMKHAMDLYEAMQKTEKEREADKKRREEERPAGGCPVMRGKKKPASGGAATAEVAAAPASAHPTDMDVSKIPPGTDPSNGQCPFFQKKDKSGSTEALSAPSPAVRAASAVATSSSSTAAKMSSSTTKTPSSLPVEQTAFAKSTTDVSNGGVTSAGINFSDPSAWTWKNVLICLFENRTVVMMVILAFLCGVLFEQRFGRRF